MTLAEAWYFLQHARQTFRSVGAVIPTSPVAARAMAAEVARRPAPRTILEGGAGTGAITATLVRLLQPGDQLIVCELNPEYMAFLRQRFARDPAFQRVRDQVRLVEGSVTDLEPGVQVDVIVSAIPFTSLPIDVTRAILERYRTMLKPGGVFTYIEYAYMRALKGVLATDEERHAANAVNVLLDTYIAQHQFRRDLVWRNVPPAWIRHLHLSPPQPQDALALAPLPDAYRVRLPLGLPPLDQDVLPFTVGLKGVAALLKRAAPRSRAWLLPMSLVGLVGWFLRDPERAVQPDPDTVYAACDGRVLAVEQVEDARFGPGPWLRIAVFLSLLDVHINRAPVAGQVVAIVHEEGGFAAAQTSAAVHNQAQYTVLEGPHGRCVVAQRVGLVARRIVNRSHVGGLLAQGERFGLMRMGSRTDVYLPAAQAEPCVQPGERVWGGVTVLARYHRS